MTKQIHITPDGRVLSVDIDLSKVGFEDVESHRASHIYPLRPIKRLAFILLRLLFGDCGRVAAWTRQWYGPWRAQIITTGQVFVHQSRRACIEWERKTINQHLTYGSNHIHERRCALHGIPGSARTSGRS